MGSSSSGLNTRFHLTAEHIINECGPDSHIGEKHILLTGATSGIGIETCRALACAGAKVYLMGRDETKLQGVFESINNELKEKKLTGSVQSVLCDLSSLVSVKQCAQKFIREHLPLNVLVLNAGLVNTRFTQTVDGLEQVMGVNHIAQAYLTQLLMPILITNGPSRVVVVASCVHIGETLDYTVLDRMNSRENDAKNGWGIQSSYKKSKLANVLYARAFASRYKEKKVTVYSLHPGVIDTNLAAKVPFSRVFTSILYKKKTVPEGAATTVYCALKPGLESETGRYFDDSAVTDVADKWTDDDLNTFWQWTEKVIQERTANL